MTTLYAHQQRGVDIMAAKKRHLFAYDTGTGKTLMTLMGLQRCPGPTLVLTKLAIVEPAWVEDAINFLPRGHPLFTITGTKKQRLDGLDDARRCGIAVGNYEAAFASRADVLAVPWRTVILDESTVVKNPKAKITRFLHDLCWRPDVSRCYLLSGCPFPNNLMEAWSQVHLIDRSVFPPSFYAFRAEYFYQPNPSGQQWLWVPRPGAEARIRNKIHSVSTWVRKEDCLDLPPQTEEVHSITLSAAERAAYDDFLRDLVLRIDDGEIAAYNALTELMKARQLTSGLVRDAEGGWHTTGESKWKYLDDLLDTQCRTLEGEPKQVIIVGQFRYELEELAARYERIRRKPAILYGGMSARGRTDTIKLFQQGGILTLLLHPAAAGYGLTFTSCDTMIFSSLSYSWLDHYQVMQRIHRIGQHHPCTYHYLIAKDTIDEDIRAAHGKKESVTEDLLSVIRRKHPARIT